MGDVITHFFLLNDPLRGGTNDSGKRERRAGGSLMMRNTGIRSLNIIIIWYERPLYNTRHGGTARAAQVSAAYLTRCNAAHYSQNSRNFLKFFSPPEYNRVLSATEYLITIDKCGKSRSCEGMEPAASDTIHLSQLQLGIITLLQQPPPTKTQSLVGNEARKRGPRGLSLLLGYLTLPQSAASRTNIVAVSGVESILSLIRRQSLMTFPLVWKYYFLFGNCRIVFVPIVSIVSIPH